ncbi:Pls/PosA family non-ribosomal peptide synthetase [Streptantibioticus cattleyicolor]|uniref:Epsilon-poly-L-lysine synthase n=1 Tax=Streptantibioticus cattleyicolor (strain ATCC 35852 / DSM 46488 / JCM 4925 / NBRC 14057 / NRRL 8057) TaxID=1003195 RepID=F8JKM4_STREN|nr:Pls/PosA family non-ribosomal peptide synthetase [Streptantibioticus cattleyicolor]AEW98485.1 epsilon-poly-L-lysine synthase [Streptantibioticus cattleyicolor NRRL 8057 = DSM 46488]CCB72458.1 Epsilon-poly-L-lysine synthase [Streptantibioticus cattleyicolor NRRL 8057 = DSM 46488]
MAAHPEAPAVDDGTVVLSYRALLADVTAFAGKLRSHGIGPGDRVGIRVPSGTADLYVAVLGVLHAGAAYVPVDADDPDERAEMIWTDARVCAVVGAGLAVHLRPEVAVGGVERGPGPGDDAWVIFTSGTTGRPKGVAVGHRSAAAFVDAEAGLFCRERPLGPGDRVLAGLSVAFDASCEEMWLAWRHGGCLVPAPREVVRAGADLGPWLVERGVTVVSTVPTLAALWPVEALARVRLLIVGGEACPAELVERLGAGREMWNTYGPTETTVVALAARLVPGEPVRIGVPLAGWEVAVVDARGRAVAWGGTGELLIAGVGTARYLDAVKDAEKFGAHPVFPGRRVYRSGDLVRAERAGLVFAGRADEQVKLAGRRIELGEVDAALSALPGVRAAAAAVRQSPAGGQVLVGYLVAEDGPLDLAALRHRLLDALPQALVPVLTVVDRLPVRTSGKVDRAALPWPLPTQERPADAGEAPTGTAGWLAGRWQDVLGVPVDAGADFFALGGSSLAAARLVTVLRERFPEVSVADVYRHPTLTELAARLDEFADSGTARREVRPVPRRTGVVQFLVLLVLFTVTGIRWLLAVAAMDDLVGPVRWAPHASWWAIGAGWLALSSAPARLLIGAGAARLLTRGIRPGSHPRGGRVHLRVWTAERVVAAFGVPSLLGTPWARLYAKLLGCRVGRGVVLHAMPPVTGMAEFGDGCVLEPEADASGHWLDGDQLRLGPVRLGPGARVATRATLLPGARVGAGADIAPGAAVTGEVPDGERWTGSPARPDQDTADHTWPKPRTADSRRWHAAYGAALLGFNALPLLAAVPALAVLWWLARETTTLGGLVTVLLWTAVPLTLLSLVCYAGLLALTVRIVGRGLTPGHHPADGRAAWCAWVVTRLMDQARGSLFPLYASLLTPTWMRALGARVGRRAEISTVLALPGLTTVDDGAFLADDTLVAPFEVRGGWLRLGRSAIGERAFVGNSGIVGPDRALPDNALVGVLSDAPAHAEPGGSWLGRPTLPVPRKADGGDPSRTYDPPRRLVAARAAVELCRVVPVLCTVLLADVSFAALQDVVDADGWTAAGLLAGVILFAAGVVACLLTTAAKWLLVGRFRAAEHPLWSSFVWRNELYDTFVEEVAMPWLGSAVIGTPLLNAWLRTLGARIGRGVWCDSHWLPETDLVRLDDGASVNRGCVLQTHLFHDRLMRVDAVHLGRGATLGPHSIALPATTVADGTVVGPASLVMRGERLPADTRWLGNPVAAWTTGPADADRTPGAV